MSNIELLNIKTEDLKVIAQKRIDETSYRLVSTLLGLFDTYGYLGVKLTLEDLLTSGMVHDPIGEHYEAVVTEERAATTGVVIDDQTIAYHHENVVIHSNGYLTPSSTEKIAAYTREVGTHEGVYRAEVLEDDNVLEIPYKAELIAEYPYRWKNEKVLIESEKQLTNDDINLILGDYVGVCEQYNTTNELVRITDSGIKYRVSMRNEY